MIQNFKGTKRTLIVRLGVLGVSECIGVLPHMQQYFSYICDGTDVQADWKRSCTYGQAPNALDIL